MAKPPPPENASNTLTIKYLLVAFLSLGCGFVAFNLSSILASTHNALSLSHHHKTTAFCAFIGCTDNTEDVRAPPATKTAPTGVLETKTATTGVLETKKATVAATQTPSTDKKAEEQTEKAAKPKEKSPEQRKIEEITAILSTRVCGSPAIDGYMHVVPKCLEESPTNKWYQEYYKSGGKQEDLVVHIEKAADYDGLAVKWGLKNTVKDEHECAEQCLTHMPKQIPGPFTNTPCNAFAFCPDDVCFEPDAHHHTKGDCWLKFTEGPVFVEVNMRGDLPEDYRKRHPNAPARTQWISGVLLPKGVMPTNGTWGPRWKW